MDADGQEQGLRPRGLPLGTLVAVSAGVGLGLLYYFTVGCQTGGCILGSQWWSSAAYGGAMGYLAKLSWVD